MVFLTIMLFAAYLFCPMLLMLHLNDKFNWGFDYQLVMMMMLLLELAFAMQVIYWSVEN